MQSFYPYRSFKNCVDVTNYSRYHTEYLIQTYTIIVLVVYSKLMKNLASLRVFNTI